MKSDICESNFNNDRSDVTGTSEREEMMSDRKLRRSTVDRMLCGVCGGVGEFFGIDSTIVRLIWAVCGVMGYGIVAYILAAIIIPSDL